MLSYLRLEIRRSLRDVRFIVLVMAWPVGAYLLFSTVFGNSGGAEGLSPKVGIMVAMACFGAIGAALNATGPRIAVERQVGWLRQLRLTPLAAWKVLVARIVSAVMLTLPSIALIFIAAFLAEGVRFSLTTWIELAAVVAVGSLPFAAIGVLLGCVGGGDGVQGFSLVVYLVLSALGGLWMPVALLPSPMQTLAHLLPSNGLASVGWHVVGGTASLGGGVLVLACWLVAVGAVAVVASRRLAVRA